MSLSSSRSDTVAQIDPVTRLIAAFGFTNPVVIDRDNAMVSGRARLEAARSLGWDIPTVQLEHLSPDQVRAFRTAEVSDWDDDLLRTEIMDLSELQVRDVLDFDLTVIDFCTPALDLIIGDNSDDPGAPAEETPDT